jgi:hypothetical protein
MDRMNQFEICLTHFLFRENRLKTIHYIATALCFGLEYIRKVKQNEKEPKLSNTSVSGLCY